MKYSVFFLLVMIFICTNTTAQNKQALYTAKYTEMGSSIDNTNTTLGNFNTNTTDLTTVGDSNNTTLPFVRTFDRIVKVDLAGLLKKELAFELEKPLKDYRSYVFRTGVKFHPKTDLESGKYTTQFTKIHSTSRQNIFVVIASSNSGSKFKGEKRPFAALKNDFVPNFPFNLTIVLGFMKKVMVKQYYTLKEQYFHLYKRDCESEKLKQVESFQPVPQTHHGRLCHSYLVQEALQPKYYTPKPEGFLTMFVFQADSPSLQVLNF